MTDDLRTRAREAAEGYCGTNTIEIETFIDGALWHASQQPTRTQMWVAVELALASACPADHHLGEKCHCPDPALIVDAILALPNGGDHA